MKLIKQREVNEFLLKFLFQVRTILEEKFVGLYIGGSLATDSFEAETSDIDCYVVTEGVLSENLIKKIEEFHQRFYLGDLPFSSKIEASYIPKDDLLNFDPEDERPYFNEGQFHLGAYGNNYLIELCVLRESGVTLSGPDIKNLVKEISVKNLRLAIRDNLHEYWESALKDSSKFRRSDYQVFAILTMCRSLYSLDSGKIASKKEAAQWAVQNLEAKWKHLIEQARDWKPGQEIDKLNETGRFVSYVINECEQRKF